MVQKPSIPKGTRDFNAIQISKRNHIVKTITESFIYFGFQPIETPSFEKSSTLLGKYGEEGDRLIFKILDSGDYLQKVDAQLYQHKNSNDIAAKISSKALRYDLTVPFARYVVQHQHELTFPFKRYQIQPVWRADRPQKGRFREFYQCDADVVGSKSLWQEVDFIQLYDTVFDNLNLRGCTIKLNNRKILSGIAEIIGESDKLIDFTVALDKLDKIGKEKVIEEMIQKGIRQDAIHQLEPIFNLKGDIQQKLKQIQKLLSSSATGKEGINELNFIVDQTKAIGLKSTIVDFDVTLARGLNYYTGAILELQAPQQINIGSIGGGGRYDDLTGIFGLKDMSGVGVSFGLDRIYLVMQALDLFPKSLDSHTTLLFINFGEKEAARSMQMIKECREVGITAELYPEADKMKKQMTYANKKDVTFVVLVGQNEIENKTLSIKNMHTGEQQKIDQNQLIEFIYQNQNKTL